ncbi:MAG: ribonuclease H-like domain-containing protein [Alphaproteobacteria bacterium]
MPPAHIHLHKDDLPDNLNLGTDIAPSIAIDTETLGLNPLRDRLCLIQLSSGDGQAHLVQFNGTNYNAPNLKKILANPNQLKIFHFARFDLAVISHWLNVKCEPVWCTKIASKISRTYSDKHGLKDLCEVLLNVKISKQQQSSDWGNLKLSDAQQHYAANDVLHLHKLKEELLKNLARDKRDTLAQECFNFLPTRAQLDLLGWNECERDVFRH